jgi:basic amino acid/polyamine antiporter, APA family
LDRENIPSHYLVRVSHNTTEAILATIEEQRVDLLVTDFETLRQDRKLSTLMTCKVLAIKAENDTLELEPKQKHFDSEIDDPQALGEGEKRSMVAIYDGGNHSDILLKAISWLEHSGMFRVGLISIVRGGGDGHNNKSSVTMQQDYLRMLGINLKEVNLPEGSPAAADGVLAAVSMFQPDIVILGATVAGYSVFQNPDFLTLLDQFNCPVIIAREFTIPGVRRAKSAIMRVFK